MAEVQHLHSWVAGMMCVADEDLDLVAATRRVECESCDAVYKPQTAATDAKPVARQSYSARDLRAPYDRDHGPTNGMFDVLLGIFDDIF